MTEEERRGESDQLPEEAPAEEIPNDAPGEARDEAESSAGVPGEEGQATGNPKNAG